MNILRMLVTAFVLTLIAMPASSGYQMRYYQLGGQKPLTEAAKARSMNDMVNVDFGSDVAVVGDAVDVLLDNTHYSLAETPADDPMRALLASPLDNQARQLGNMPLQDALRAVGGDDYRLFIDPDKKEVRYLQAKKDHSLQTVPPRRWSREQLQKYTIKPLG